MSSKKMRLRWTMDPREIPDGWTRLASYKEDDYDTIYSCIRHGIISTDECIKFRLTPTDDRGPIYVDPAAASRAIAGHASAVASRRQASALAKLPQCQVVADGQVQAAVIALCEINNGITLMHATLERLTAAVESIATQPKTAQQELVSTFESNGFHQ